MPYARCEMWSSAKQLRVHDALLWRARATKAENLRLFLLAVLLHHPAAQPLPFQ
jgi:hypothetical protein